MNSRLGFGPMSREIIDILCQWTTASERQLMIIASRNQVDAGSGYVMNTAQMRDQIRSQPNDHVILCRDHCGPYFLDTEKSLDLSQAVEATKKTIAGDIEAGFDLIHIDTSRVDDTYGIAEELIEFCLKLNPGILFEFGTEENVGVAAGAVKYKQDVAFAKNFPNMQFVVAQTGSLCFEDTQAGGFDSEVVADLVACANDSGVKLKEHNADYLTAEQIQLRKSVGVHALNIAPQLGVVQTKLLKRLAQANGITSEWNTFSQKVLDSGRWRKWTHSNTDDQKVVVAGHYCFASDEYQQLVDKINQHEDFASLLYSEISQVFDNYYNNLY